MKTTVSELEFQEAEQIKLESLVYLSKIGEYIFFDTCCIRGFEKFNFNINSYKKLKARKLEETYLKLNLFFDFIRGRRVSSIKEIIDEVVGLKDKLNRYKEGFVRRGAIRKKGCTRLPSEAILDRKKEFYDILDLFGEIFLETRKSIYIPQNKETYSRIKNLVKKSAACVNPPVEGKGEIGLVATAIYRALLDNKSTSIASQDGQIFDLFRGTYDKFQYNKELLDTLQQSKIKIYFPDPKRGREFSLSMDNSTINFKRYNFKFKKRFSILVQKIRESLD